MSCAGGKSDTENEESLQAFKCPRGSCHRHGDTSSTHGFAKRAIKERKYAVSLNRPASPDRITARRIEAAVTVSEKLTLEARTIMDEVRNSRFTTFRTITRALSRRWTVCGLFTLLGLTTGCDPCMNNPCNDGIACNGVETCTADGGQAVCTDGTPVSCDAPTACTEPDGACVDAGETTDDDTPARVDVLQLGNFFYPTGMFRCADEEGEQPPDEGCPTGAGCDAFHWHSDTVTAISSVSDDDIASETAISDPDPCRCGHGKVSEVIRTTIDVSQLDMSVYLEVASLSELPAAGTCPP